MRPGLLKRRLWILLFPPGHLCLRHAGQTDLVRLPHWGWCRTNTTLFLTLREKLEIPMICVALMIVPCLLIEWKGFDTLSPSFPGGEEGLHVTLMVTHALIWTAFAFEFLLMVSLAQDRLLYCKEAWLDILIILLPLIAFLRSARVLRAVRLNQLARGYRFKSVAIKLRRTMLIANAIQRFIQKNPEKRAVSLLTKSRQRYKSYLEPETQLIQLLEGLEPEKREEILRTLEAQLQADEDEQAGQP